MTKEEALVEFKEFWSSQIDTRPLLFTAKHKYLNYHVKFRYTIFTKKVTAYSKFNLLKWFQDFLDYMGNFI
jgi:hypothetical protein